MRFPVTVSRTAKVRIGFAALLVAFVFRGVLCSIVTYSLPPDLVRAAKLSSEVTIMRIARAQRADGSPDFDGDLHREYHITEQKVLHDPTMAIRVIAHLDRQVMRLPLINIACFEPAYAVRVTSGADAFDVLVCYHCQSLVVFRNDELIAQRELSMFAGPGYFEALFAR
jgi:hypothetical protein